MKSKKLLALLLAAVTTLSMTSMTSFAFEQSEILGSFFEFYLNGAFEGFVLYPQTEGEMIAGPDDYSVMPASEADTGGKLDTPDPRVVYIVAQFADGKTQSGTGYFISNRVVATSAHIVFKGKSEELPSKITIYPGLDDVPMYTDKYYTGMSVVTNGLYHNPDDDQIHDYALIPINETANVGYFGFTGEHATDEEVKTIGYPQDDLWHQHESNGKITEIYDNILMTDLISQPGQSGSPLFDKDYLSHGLLRGSDENHHAGFIKIDKDIFNLFLKYRNKYK